MNSAAAPLNRFALVSTRVVTPDGERPAAVIVSGERIEAVVGPADVPRDVVAEDVGDAVIAPGLIDAHVHINEPGRTEWEGFATATAAAAAGGVTTLVDMPLNCSPVTTTAAALEAKRSAAGGQCRVDVGLYGGAIPGSEPHLPELLDAGVLGVKVFLCDSGLAEFPRVTARELNAVMLLLAERNVPLLVHGELADDGPPLESTRSYAKFRESRPDDWEVAAIRQMIELCREHRCHVHVVHLSSVQALAEIAAAKAEGLPLTVETCPHYLYFSAEEIPDGDTRFKCAPPIRGRENGRRLWSALADGLIDTIGSDHSPCPPEMKRLDTGDFASAWGGISSLQFMLPVVWTAGRNQGVSREQLARWFSENPARLLGLQQRKGRIAAGYDADLVVWDPDAEFVVEPGLIRHRHKITPYEGRTLRGIVQRTYVRGQVVWQDGQIVGRPLGTQILRTRDEITK